MLSLWIKVVQRGPTDYKRRGHLTHRNARTYIRAVILLKFRPSLLLTQSGNHEWEKQLFPVCPLLLPLHSSRLASGSGGRRFLRRAQLYKRHQGGKVAHIGEDFFFCFSPLYGKKIDPCGISLDSAKQLWVRPLASLRSAPASEVRWQPGELDAWPGRIRGRPRPPGPLP